MDQSYPSSAHLKSSERISEVYQSGEKLKQGFLLLFYLPSNESGHKIAFAVPKRKISSAVRRNRIKRLMREAFRKHKALLPQGKSYDMVLLFLGDEPPESLRLEKSYQKLWEKWAKSSSL